MHVQALSGNVEVSDEDQGSGQCEARHSGCILADEMGLGKTVQVLAASWAMMCMGGPSGRPLVRKMLVVAPSRCVSPRVAAMRSAPCNMVRQDAPGPCGSLTRARQACGISMTPRIPRPSRFC